MTGIKNNIAAILLLLSSAGLHADAHLPSVPIESLLKGVVVGHYQGITGHSFKEATRFYHSDSPDVVRIQNELSQAAYFQKTKILSFSIIDECEEFAIGRASHRFLRISGMKFSEEFADAEYVFRKEGGAWKLWSSRMISDGDAIHSYNSKETQ